MTGEASVRHGEVTVVRIGGELVREVCSGRTGTEKDKTEKEEEGAAEKVKENRRKDRTRRRKRKGRVKKKER